MNNLPAIRHLRVPSDIDVTGVPEVQSQSGAISFAAFFRDVIVPLLPWGTADQQDAIESLARLGSASPGQVIEIREADHAALVRAMADLRTRLPGHVTLALGAFFAAVARASTAAP